MRLARLSLLNMRSFPRLDLEPGPGAHVIYGENGTGKSNLLEAISLLSTARSPRAARDGELIGWRALAEDPLPAAQLGAVVALADGSRTNLEITVMARAAVATAATTPGRGRAGSRGDAPLPGERHREARVRPDRAAAHGALLG